ncbi:tetratricopeptide repeat protein [Chloroflexi bacterium TSY]|nr:tetratricopeptide repeat protein [Chloroflexi bacterium TSY]
MSSLKVYCIGPPRITRDDEPVELGRRTALALLIYLAVTGRQRSRDTIAAMFWPDLDQSRARKALRRDLSVLNKILGKVWFTVTRSTIGVNPEAGLWVDVHHFRRLVEVAEPHDYMRLEEAVTLYQDDFLAGFTLPNSPQFDEWQFFHTEKYRRQYATTLEILVENRASQADYRTAIDYAHRWLALDPLHEPVHRHLMQLYIWSGQQGAALRQYDECVHLLAKELDAPPAEETTALYNAIHAQRLIVPDSNNPKFRIASSQSDLEPIRKAVVSPTSFSSENASSQNFSDKYLEPQRNLDTQDRGRQSYPDTSRSSHLVAKHNLPPQPTPFIGREQEMAEIQQFVLREPNCRLLTLVGPGGIGKTRLALAVGQSIVESAVPPPNPQSRISNLNFKDGVYFVSLAPVNVLEFLVNTIAEALNFTFYSGADPKTLLLNYLREKAMLLVLDNFEQIIEGTELLSEIVLAAPGVQLLVTSRERLNIQEEWGYDIEGLAFPQTVGGLHEADLETLETYSAVHLFVQSARRAQASFHLTREESPHVVHICQLLAGMPLGLELAATWVRMMSCREISQEISQNLDFLTTSLRNVPARHRSLRAVFDHSWTLLAENEKLVLRQLTVFRGGFTREAAEVVADATLSLLSALVDKSLLRRTRGGRYEMHELVRQFATERLERISGASDEVQNRHSQYYLVWLRKQKARLFGHKQQESVEEIATEIDNVRSAWRWGTTQRNVTAVGRTLDCLMLFHDIRGRFREAEASFRNAADEFRQLGLGVNVQNATPAAREQDFVYWQLRVHQAFFLHRLGHAEASEKLIEECIHHLRVEGPEWREVLAYALVILSLVRYYLGRYAEARKYVLESWTALGKNGDRWLTGHLFFVMALVAEAQAQYDEAVENFRAAVTIFKELGDSSRFAFANTGLGRVRLAQGVYAEAIQHIQEALEVRQMLGDRPGIALSHTALGYAAEALGRFAEAAQYHETSAALHRETGNNLWATFCQNDMGNSLLALGQFERAQQICQQSLDFFRQAGDRVGIAHCLYNLGKIALETREFDAAQHSLQESLALRRTLDNQEHVAHSLNALGQSALATGDEKMAQNCFHEALDIASKLECAPVTLAVLVSWAALLQRNGENERAIELLTLVEHHIASGHETKENARRLRTELAIDAPSEVVEAAKAHGQTLELPTSTIDSLLLWR